MNFSWFKSCVVSRAVFERLELAELLESAESWPDLRKRMIDVNNQTARFAPLVFAVHHTMSSGEQVVLCAIFYAMDFAALADALGGSFKWQNLNAVSGDYRRVVAACIALQD